MSGIGTFAMRPTRAHGTVGAAWSRDGKTLAVQCMVEKDLEMFAFDGQSLRRTGEVRLSGGGAGIRVSTK